MAFAGFEVAKDPTNIAYQTAINTPMLRTTIQPQVNTPAMVGGTVTTPVQQRVIYTPTITGTRTPPTTTPDVPIQTQQKINNSIELKATANDELGQYEGANNILRKAENQRTMSAVASAGSAIMGMMGARQYAKDVKATKIQYENKKKAIDTNISNNQSLMYENYQSQMGQIDAVAASKNIDISSGSIIGLKEQGLSNMGKDIRDMQGQTNINKLALDLDYAMNVKEAETAKKNAYIGGALQLGTTALGFF